MYVVDRWSPWLTLALGVPTERLFMVRGQDPCGARFYGTGAATPVAVGLCKEVPNDYPRGTVLGTV